MALVLFAGGALVMRRARTGATFGPLAPAERAARKGAPPLRLLLALTALLLLKVVVIDRTTTWLRCVTTPSRVCGAENTTDIAFAGAPGLRGYTLPTPRLRPGDVLRLNLYWQGIENANGPIQSFVHVRNSQKDWPVNPETGSEIWAQDEHVAPGNLLSTEFILGKIYLDEFHIRLPEGMPAGEYYLEIGWFNPATGEQIEPAPDTVKPPYRILWRSVLLPNLEVE
jgi:hypothetical protein